MAERSRAELLADLLASLFLAASIAAFAMAQRGGVVWLLLLPALAGAALPAPRLAATLRRPVEYLSWVGAAATGALGLSFTLYPVLSEGVTLKAAAVLAALLALVGAAALAARAAPGLLARAVVPASLGLLVLGALVPREPFASMPATVLSALALLGLLAIAGRAAPGRAPRPALLPLACFAAGCAALALGIVRFLPWAQPRTEAALARWIEPRAAPRLSGLDFTSRLGDIEELALSARVVMRVFTDVPQRLRVRVLTRFDGAAWHAEPAASSVALSPLAAQAGLPPALASWLRAIPGTTLAIPGRPLERASGPGAVRTKIVQEDFDAGALVMPAAPVLVNMPRLAGRVDAFGILTTAPSEQVDLYGVVNNPGGGAPAEGAPSGSLAVPRDTDERVRALAVRLSEGSPAERVRRTLAFLSRGYRYSLRVGKFRTAQPVAEFLLEKKEGYCEFFATAAALLLRLEGVPARYVTGFNVRDNNYAGGHYVVQERDAHAWIEVFLPGEGWVEQDPTPSAQYDALHGQTRAALPAQVIEAVRAWLAELAARLREGDWLADLRWLLSGLLPPAVALLALAALAGALRRLWRRRTRDRVAAAARDWGQVPAELGRLLSRVEAAWARHGRKRPAARALLEHLDAIPEDALPGPLRAASARIVESFYAARFGARSVPEAELLALRSQLERAELA